MYGIDSPLLDACRGYADASPVRFHMPGHKGRAVFSSPDISLDLTELPRTGTATEPGDEIFSAAYGEASKLYGTSATVYSAGGATLALQAAVALAKARKSVFACFRSVHRSVINAFALLDIDPVWIDSAEDIPRGSAVVVTSPDYYGRMADIGRLADTAHERESLLIVDCAHGAHLAFYDGGRLHPLRRGADIVADSLHKTLPALTGSALLHAMPADITAEECQAAMRLFGSTSPSYLINLSTERCLFAMSREGEALHSALLRKINAVREELSGIGCELLSRGLRDPFRVVLRMDNARSFERKLSENGVICEFADRRHIVLIPSVCCTDGDFERLTEVCAGLADLSVPCREPETDDIYGIEPPPKAMSLRSAVLSPHETVDTDEAVGRVCGEAATPYPPGVPAVMPGEIFTREAAGVLIEGGCRRVCAVKEKIRNADI